MTTRGNIKRIGVIGAGIMGQGISQVAAAKEFEVILSDITEDLVQKGKTAISKNLHRLVEKGKMDDSKQEEILGRIQTTSRIEEMKEVDFVIEAVSENEQLKRDIFSKLDQICEKGIILSTNTSSIPITRIASVTKRPEAVIGMHFINPVPVMRLVEVIRGLATSEETFCTVKDLAERLGKIPVLANDFPGFIANRILCPMINEAVYAVFEGVGTIGDIDAVMKLGMNHPMGPLELADMIGLDTVLATMKVLT